MDAKDVGDDAWLMNFEDPSMAVVATAASPVPSPKHTPKKAVLVDAVCAGDLLQVCELLYDGIDVNQTKPECGSTACHMAVLLRDDGCLSLLLDHKADPNMRNKHGVTSLHFAANPGYPPVLAELLVKAKSLLSVDAVGYTAMQIAKGEHPNVAGSNPAVEKLLGEAMGNLLQEDVQAVVLHCDVRTVEREWCTEVCNGDDFVRWAAKGELRLLLSSLPDVLWPAAKWKHVTEAELVSHEVIKRAYIKAIKACHPDRVMQYKDDTILRRRAAAIFDVLKKAYGNYKSAKEAFGCSPMPTEADLDNWASSPAPFDADNPFSDDNFFAKDEDNVFARDEDNVFAKDEDNIFAKDEDNVFAQFPQDSSVFPQDDVEDENIFAEDENPFGEAAENPFAGL